MEFKVEQSPDFSWLTVQVPAQKKLFVEAGAMATMTTNMSMRALFKGGFRRFFSGESLFVSEFTAQNIDGEVCISPGVVGDVGHVKLTGEKFYLASSSYVAHSDGINYTTKFQRLSQGLLSGAGWFLIEMSGSGDVWFNSYGALETIDVNDDLLLDNGHIVGFTEGIQYEITKLGGYKSLLFSGEGFVCRFKGQGKVFVQTKKPAGLINWADQFRPVQRNSQN
jgi:uncharacterized protein (TIGR00266 family)